MVKDIKRGNDSNCNKLCLKFPSKNFKYDEIQIRWISFKIY